MPQPHSKSWQLCNHKTSDDGCSFGYQMRWITDDVQGVCGAIRVGSLVQACKIDQGLQAAATTGPRASPSAIVDDLENLQPNTNLQAPA